MSVWSMAQITTCTVYVAHIKLEFKRIRVLHGIVNYDVCSSFSVFWRTAVLSSYGPCMIPALFNFFSIVYFYIIVVPYLL